MSADSNGIDVQLVFKNNSADVAGSALYRMMSNFYDSTGVCITVRNMFTIYHSRGILFMFPAVVTQKHVYISVAYNCDNNRH